MTETMKIVAVATSLSEDSTTLKLTNRILTGVTSAGESVGIDIETETINVGHLATALTDMTVTGFRSEALEAAFDTIAEADAIVTVAPVYKAAPVGLHTLFWQLIDERALVGTPVLIASTGGTVRHSLAGEAVLRPMLAYLKGIVVPTTVFAATDDWGSLEGGRALSSRVRQAAEELVSLTSTITARFGDSLAEAAVDRDLADAAAVDRGDADRTTMDRGPASRQTSTDAFDPENVTPFARLLEG